MARILRFVAENETTIRLDLNNPAGFTHGRGLIWGSSDVDRAWLGTAGVDGDVSTGDRRPRVDALVPLILNPQATVDAMLALHAALATELDRKKNKIEWRPDGASSSLFIRTYRAAVPPLQRGQDAPPLEALLFDPIELPLIIPRHPRAKRDGVAVFL